MLEGTKIKQVNELVSGLSKEEMIWLNGYLAGIISGNGRDVADIQPPASVKKITLTYGTETGNSKKLATTFAASAKKKGIQAKLISLDQYKLNDLEKETYFFSVISTQGDGEPPLPAKKFYDHIHVMNKDLSGLHYGILALGDTSYPLFCKAGEDVDAQFKRMGAKPVIPLTKLDTDYESEASDWFERIVQSLHFSQPAFEPVKNGTVKKKGKQVYRGTVTEHINLNGSGSDKETYHIEIVAEGVSYEPGDALGMIPHNSKKEVEKILEITKADPDTIVNYKGESFSLTELLTKKLCIVHLPERVVQKYKEITGQDIPETRIDLADLLIIYPVAGTEQFLDFVQFLEPNAPRLYSISSALAATENEVHLTVSKHRYFVNKCEKTGLCSDHLASLKIGDELDFYIHKNHLFKLPAPDKDIIMVGPGTGVAPFRSFVAEREARGDEGRSWLFFGDRNFENDFLYQTEWQNHVATGTLTKMNVAFSRDQPEKLYVQHKILQHKNEVWDWLQNGAYLYVCGAKDPMSVDVENTLLQVIEDKLSTTTENAAAYLNELKEAGRYVLDVY